MHEVLFPISEQLNLVRSRINRRLFTKEGHVEDYIFLAGKAEAEICSSLVLYSARNYGLITERVISLAEVMQYLFLAIMTHDNVNEDNHPNNQYPVLIGDYFLGWFFTTLCNAGMANYLNHISQILCAINERAVIRLKQTDEAGSTPARLVSPHPEYAEVFGECCMLGGMEAGADKQQQQCLRELGHALGMALGRSDNLSCKHREEFFNEALSKLEGLHPGNSKDDLRHFIYYLMKNGMGGKKMVC